MKGNWNIEPSTRLTPTLSSTSSGSSHRRSPECQFPYAGWSQWQRLDQLAKWGYSIWSGSSLRGIEMATASCTSLCTTTKSRQEMLRMRSWLDGAHYGGTRMMPLNLSFKVTRSGRNSRGRCFLSGKVTIASQHGFVISTSIMQTTRHGTYQWTA